MYHTKGGVPPAHARRGADDRSDREVRPDGAPNGGTICLEAAREGEGGDPRHPTGGWLVRPGLDEEGLMANLWCHCPFCQALVLWVLGSTVVTDPNTKQLMLRCPSCGR